MRLRLSSTLLLAVVTLTPNIASAEFDNSVPVRNLTGKAPIVVTDSSVFFLNNGNNRVCVSFRNIAAKPASEVDFTFRFDDQLGSPMREAVLNRTGSFGPGILIEGVMNAFNGNSDALKNCRVIAGAQMKPSREIIDETRVVFEDGTVWKKGESFVAAYTSSGTKLSAALTVAGTAGAAPPGGATVTVGGATGHGGSIATAGGYGTIAWLPGSRTAIGTAVDASSQDIADYTAMSECNGLAPNKTGCTVQVRMSGADKKCGAVATDDKQYGTAYGPNMNDTIKAALDSLQAQGGVLAPNNIIAAKCN